MTLLALAEAGVIALLLLGLVVQRHVMRRVTRTLEAANALIDVLEQRNARNRRGT